MQNCDAINCYCWRCFESKPFDFENQRMDVDSYAYHCSGYCNVGCTHWLEQTHVPVDLASWLLG